MTKLVSLIVLVLLLGATSNGQAEPAWGEDDYMRYCSACHGEAADGKGPVSNVLSTPPPALTRLHEKYGKPLATPLVTYVMGTTMPRSHGTSEMPVWGKNLQEPEGGDSEAVLTIWRIVAYLESIQSE